jgi:hypothetical protein
MGLLDILPEIFSEPVIEKLKYVHRLIRKARHYPAEEGMLQMGK